jgi:hypothetical protein
VLRLVRIVVEEAGKTPVAICGELAGQDIPTLLKLGVRSLSVAPLVPRQGSDPANLGARGAKRPIAHLLSRRRLGVRAGERVNPVVALRGGQRRNGHIREVANVPALMHASPAAAKKALFSWILCWKLSRPCI